MMLKLFRVEKREREKEKGTSSEDFEISFVS